VVPLEEAVIFLADALSATARQVDIEFGRFTAKVLSFTPPAVAALMRWGRHTRQPLTIGFRAARRFASEEWIAAVRAIKSGSRVPFARLLAAEQWTARLFRAPSMIGLVRDPASRP
jgi:hypothetical protein